MRLIFELLFDLALLLGGAAVGWRVGSVGVSRLLAVGVFGFAWLVGGATSGHSPYPWTNLPVLLFALGGGSALGRALSPYAWGMSAVLALLSLADLTLAILPSPTPPSSVEPAGPFLYGNLVLFLSGGGRFVLGALDLLVATALGAYTWQRSLPFLTAVGTISLGLALAFLVAAVHPTHGLPLLAFFYGGWLIAGRWIRRNS